MTEIKMQDILKANQRSGHVLYTDHDADRPDVICDRNGQVVLGLCKVCGKAEAQLLEGPCVPQQSENTK